MRPFKELKTHALAKKPTPVAPKPHPAVSSYRKAPSAISISPMITMIKVAHPKTVFLFIPIFCGILIFGNANIVKTYDSFKPSVMTF